MVDAYNVRINKELLPGLLSRPDGLAKLIENILNQILEAQITEQLGVARHERSAVRRSYRNGYRSRTLHTRIGALNLIVPQTRDGSFCSDIFTRYQRNEPVFNAALMEMVVRGVSTRKVSAVTQVLCGTSFSKSTISALSVGWDERVQQFNERPLHVEYPIVLLDALTIKSRDADSVVARSALIASGIRADGYREILGVKIGLAESLKSWDGFLPWLIERGLSGVRFVVSDAHGGLPRAVARHLPQAIWQHCQVHFMRELLRRTPAKFRVEMIAMVKEVLSAKALCEAEQYLGRFVTYFAKPLPRVTAYFKTHFKGAMAVTALPDQYRHHLRTTNMQERLNEEIRRRERVIRIFPNDQAALRLIATLLSQQHSAWQTKPYLEMAAFTAWQNQYVIPHTPLVIASTAKSPIEVR